MYLKNKITGDETYMNPWTYKKTNKKTWYGKTVYKAYLFNDFMGWRIKRTAADIKRLQKQMYGYTGVCEYIEIPYEDIGEFKPEESLVLSK